MAELRGTWVAYRAIILARIRSQTEYRWSFVLDLGASAFLGLVEFAELYAIFGRTRSIDGFSYVEVMLMFGFSSLSFAVADLAVGHIDTLPTYVRTGTFEALLVRPLSTIGQLATSDFSLRRVGRGVVALLVLIYALARTSMAWTPTRVAIVAVTPIIGAFIYACVFVATASVTFWFVDAGEFANAFTYGGNYVAGYPFTVYRLALRQLFTFIVPVAFVAYVPTLALLGQLDERGWPAWSGFAPVLAAVLAFLAARAMWTTGVRRYVGAGG